MAEVVNSSELQWVTGGQGQARGTAAQLKTLFRGEESGLDNYEFAHFRFVNDTQFSPRHRHDFDQFRFALKGPSNYGTDEDIGEGQLGYFPEGAYYGPQKLRNGIEHLSLQFGGASGFGFKSYAQWRHAYEELGKVGVFEKGVYTYIDPEGARHNKDGHQAMAEYINKGPVTFPKPRMARPVLMDPDAYVWVPVAHQLGITIKHFGTFNERGTFSAMIRIGAGSSYQFESEPQTRLLYILDGLGTIDSEPLANGYVARVVRNSPTSSLDAKTDMKILVFGMPRFDQGLHPEKSSIL